jgi:hypothetical protein
MKKQILILLSLVLFLLGSEQVLFSQPKYQETKLSILNKLSAQYADDRIILEFIGSFYEVNENNIWTDLNRTGGVINIDKVYLGIGSTSDVTMKSAFVSFPQISELGNIAVIEKENSIQLVLEYNNLEYLDNISVSENKITFFFYYDVVVTEDGAEGNLSDVDRVPDFLISKLYVKPTRLNVAILYKESTKKKAYALSQKLLRQKIKVEKDLDNPLNIVNITKVPLEDFGRNVIYFRENHYLSAIYISDLLKDVYVMVPFVKPERKKYIDLEILIIE